jgi:hypothetical protein
MGCRHTKWIPLSAFLVIAVIPMRADTCVPATYSSSLAEAGGIWNATSEFGGTYTLQIETEPSLEVRVVKLKPAPDDWVEVDQTPTPDEVAMGTLTGGASQQAWPEFEKGQEHPKEEALSCDGQFVWRSYSVIPPPETGGVYLRQWVAKFSFEGNPPSMTVTSDFWPASHPPNVLHFTLVRNSSFVPFGIGTLGNCSSIWGCMQTPAFAGMIAATGGLLGFFALMFGFQMDGPDFGNLIPKVDSDTLRTVGEDIALPGLDLIASAAHLHSAHELIEGANVSLSTLDAADAALSADPMKEVANAAEIFAPSQLSIPESIADFILKESGVPGSEIDQMKADAASAALDTLTTRFAFDGAVNTANNMVPSELIAPAQIFNVEPVPNTRPDISQDFVDSWNPDTGLATDIGSGEGGSSE